MRLDLHLDEKTQEIVAIVYGLSGDAITGGLDKYTLYYIDSEGGERSLVDKEIGFILAFGLIGPDKVSAQASGTIVARLEKRGFIKEPEDILEVEEIPNFSKVYMRFRIFKTGKTIDLKSNAIEFSSPQPKTPSSDYHLKSSYLKCI